MTPTPMPPPSLPPGPVHGPLPPQPGEPGWTVWPRRIWPVDPLAAAPVAVVLAAMVTALAGTLIWRVTVASIGYPVVAVLVFAAVYGTARRAPSVTESVGIAVTLALLTVPAVLAADWVNAICVMAAWIVGWCTLAGGTSWAAVLLGPWLPWALAARVSGWVQRTGQRIEFSGGRTDLRRIAIVAGATVGLLAVFGVLLAGADVAFAHLLSGVVPRLDGGEIIARSGVFVIVAMFVLFGAYLLRFRPRFDALRLRPAWSVARWEWAVPLAALDVLFAAFVAVQASVLFGGHRHVLDTAGLTYAEYARQGFWQLLVVSALTLLVIAATLAVAQRDTDVDRRLIRLLIGTLCTLSVVIVASAAHRMWLYQQAYGFTELRLLVITVEFWLGAVFLLILGAGLRMSGRWLPRAVLIAGALALLGLAVMNPDRFIAEHNITRYQQTGRLDTVYLGRLSADALPALDALEPSLRDCLRGRIGAIAPEPWYQFNLSRARAAAAAIPATDVRDCAAPTEHLTR